jgi:hypothetical protein
MTPLRLLGISALISSVLSLAVVSSAKSEVDLELLNAAAKGLGNIELLAGKGQTKASVLLVPEFHGLRIMWRIAMVGFSRYGSGTTRWPLTDF